MLYTLGTSNRTAEEFFRELTRRDVWLMVDVRSSPFSRSPWARRGALEAAAARRGISYSWSGEVLGGRNPIPSYHRDFSLAAEAVLDSTDAGPVAIFCAEGDPAQCHRSYKVAAHLMVQHGYLTTNILRNGKDESVSTTLRRTRGADLPSCIRTSLGQLSGW